MSYVRFFVEKQLPDDFRQRFMRSMRHWAMKPLRADEDVAERVGWCALGDPLDLELGYEKVFYNAYLNLGFRTDRWVIPGPLLRAKVREAEALYRERKGRERLSRSEKSELKELVTRKLRKQFLPSTRAVDLSWSLDEGIVRFFSQSQRTNLAMVELFEKTFHLELLAESPYTLAARLGLEPDQERAWEALSATMLGGEGR